MAGALEFCYDDTLCGKIMDEKSFCWKRAEAGDSLLAYISQDYVRSSELTVEETFDLA